ncbi:MAG: 2-oxoglutarate dehydrogenase E1 component [Saprospiraceae bacterium]|nr:2-oxoglutarate dehydrogenase E1 component [Saprospiraceae bacterium]
MDFSFIANAHPSYIERMYQEYKKDPNSVSSGWREFFLGFDFASQSEAEIDSVPTTNQQGINPKELEVLKLIEAYRKRGHLTSTTNPIRRRRFHFPQLHLENYGLSDQDLGRTFLAGQELGIGTASLQAIKDRLEELYAGNIGFEYGHIENQDKYLWLQKEIEAFPEKRKQLSIHNKKRILEKLNGAVGFENFLAKKYVAQKRFGLEGGESAIVALDTMINTAADDEVEEVVIGMAHRGRLNVLANIMGKTYEHIFNEFQDVMPEETFGDGDVKYHLGYSSIYKSPSGHSVNLQLAPNPSHLEAVDSVVQGFTRAKADILYKSDFDRILPILIHGDAAVAGQGVVYEVSQMSQLEGYYTGGTIHLVINNQIGFTTDFDDARSSTYCTAAAKLVQAPVFHVNGDDAEAVFLVAQLAARYRQAFNTDVYIDMVCYRKHGHNEGDDPQFTQPKLYKLIKKHKDPRTIYSNLLIESGAIEAELAKKMNKEFNDLLQDRFNMVKEQPIPYLLQEPEQAWKKMQVQTSSEDYRVSPDTGISENTALHILNTLQTMPEGFTPLRKFNRILKSRQDLIDKKTIDWSMAEHLAYGSLLLEGSDVRITGQDVKRGTFSHRNAVLVDSETNKGYNRLNHLSDKQGKFRIHNSLLSEFAVLGFEYGYSIATPETLVIWEAQFGDFANGAQSMFDQFVGSGESKWQRQSGLVLLLPHGYEGQGPEHSSARLERYLQACAEYNLTVANVTTPANFFHLIRRQLKRPFRKPLVLMAPKSLLRHPRCVSNISEFTSNNFKETFDDPAINTPEEIAKVKKVLCCSGKIYFELLDYKEKNGRDDIAIVRLEQLYPFPRTQVNQALRKYAHAKFAWVQEEPSNMGAWQYILAFYRRYEIQLISRKSSASPATGFKKRHLEEQKDIIERAFFVEQETEKSELVSSDSK